MDPRNLAKEVHVYGYNFEWQTHIVLIVLSLLGIAAIGVIFRLQAVYIALTVIAVLGMLPVIVLMTYARMYEQQRFGDACAYMEQMLYAYESEGKILSALKETREIFEFGQMRTLIDQAIVYIETGVSSTEKGFLAEGLELIEQRYECTKLHTIHDTLLSLEQHGGNAEASLYILLEDLEVWKRRGYVLQAQKKQQHTDNIISILFATGLCAVALYVLDGMRDLFSTVAQGECIMKLPVIQFTSFVFLMWQLYVLVKSFRNMASDWLGQRELQDDKYILDCYERVNGYDKRKEKRKSLLLALPCLAVTALLSLYSTWPAVVSGIITIICLCKHKIVYNIARRDVNDAIYAAMPQWMIQIALLLQHNNVQVSLARSMRTAPPVLQPELQALMNRLALHPESLTAYTEFCKEYDVPEAQSLMKMLHSIAEAGTGDANLQITNMLQRVNEMQQLSNQRQDENLRFKMQMIFMYPVLGATAKLLIDLTLGLVYMMGMMGNMGGV